MSSGYPPDWRPPQERPDPSEQPCREGTTIPPFQPPMPPTPGGGGGGVTPPPTVTQIPLMLQTVGMASANMNLTSRGCVSGVAGAIVVTDEFNSWIHADGDSAYQIGGIRTPGNGAPTANSGNHGWFVPWVVPRQTTVVDFSVIVFSAAGAGTKGRVVVYSAKTRPDNYPNMLVADCSVISGADVPLDATGVKTQTVNLTISTVPALYWVGLVVNGSVNRISTLVQPMQGPAILGRPQTGANGTAYIDAGITFPASPATPVVSTFPGGAVERQVDGFASPPAIFARFSA